MIRFFQVLCIALITSNVISQNVNGNYLEFNWNSQKYLFYETQDLKKLDFLAKNLSSETINSWKEIKTDVVKRIKFLKSEDASTIKGVIIFKESPSAIQARDFLEQMGVKEFKVNNQRILTSVLINNKEIDDLKKNFKSNVGLFTNDCNDTTKIQYYDFQIKHAMGKLMYMWDGNYPKYLYDGYVTKYVELLEKSKISRERFLKNKSK